MKRGRRPKKSALVDALAGPEPSKQRLRVIMATISGELSIPEACAQLGIQESRFFVLRAQALEGALKGILPGVPGRPSKEDTPEQAKLKEMQKRLDAMELELKATRIKMELAEALPACSPPPPPAQKKRRHRRNHRMDDR